MENKEQNINAAGVAASLEIEKLSAEVEEAKLRVKKLKLDLNNTESGLQKIWNSVTKNLGVSLSLIAATAALWIQLDGFTHQRKQRQALEVSRELVALLEKLNSDNLQVRRTAAVGLSLMGEEAIPVLIENLDFDVSPELRRTLIESLSAIATRERNAWLVLEPLLRSTVAVFERDLSRPYVDVNTTNLVAYLDALVTLVKRNRKQLSPEQSKKVFSTVATLQQNVGNSKSINTQEEKELEKWMDGLKKAAQNSHSS